MTVNSFQNGHKRDAPDQEITSRPENDHPIFTQFSVKPKRRIARRTLRKW